MQLYFLRHGDAVDSAPSDHERPLTEKGIRNTQNAATFFAALKLNPAVIYSSPRTRAQQTAEIVASALDMTVVIREEVNFNFNVAAVQTLVNENPKASALMFVGHQPFLSTIIQELTGARVEMKKGGLARVDLLDPGAMYGTLVWLLAPKVLNVVEY